MSARRVSTSAIALLATLAVGACGGSDGPSGPSSRSTAERVARALRFYDKAATMSSIGADVSAFALESAALALLVDANIGNFTVASNGAVAMRTTGGAPVTATTAGSYEGLVIRTTTIEFGMEESSDLLIGWRGGENPTDIVFAEDFSGSDGGSIFSDPNAEWLATTVTSTFSSLNVPTNCVIPTELRDQIAGGAALTCKIGTATASFNISASQPSAFGGNAATGSRTASASVTGFPALVITFNYDATR